MISTVRNSGVTSVKVSTKTRHREVNKSVIRLTL